MVDSSKLIELVKLSGKIAEIKATYVQELADSDDDVTDARLYIAITKLESVQHLIHETFDVVKAIQYDYSKSEWISDYYDN